MAAGAGAAHRSWCVVAIPRWLCVVFELFSQIRGETIWFNDKSRIGGRRENGDQSIVLLQSRQPSLHPIIHINCLGKAFGPFVGRTLCGVVLMRPNRDDLA